MSSLKQQIEALRCKTDGRSKFFVPHQSLYTLMTRIVIRDALQEKGGLPWYSLDGVVDKIMTGGRRVFAVLVMLDGEEKEILRFIEHDHFQGSPIDHKLPLSRASLDTMVPQIAGSFYERQWEFSAPVFAKDIDHRLLDEFAVLPFIKDRKIDEGGFGEVFEITLHPGHQATPLVSSILNSGLIRKEFREIIDNKNGDHEPELYNLSLLNQLKHPNIVELLGFYTYERKRNFVFPLASDGDLGRLLTAIPRTSCFQADEVFFLALARLSSAIEKLHDFTVKKQLNIQLMGCHRDLKPRNILVNKDMFILADFGLSKFGTLSQSSQAPFSLGAGDYIAPECEDYEDNFRKGVIGPSSDIWSFGCIIIEVLTYMSLGAEGVVNLRKLRTFKVGDWTLSTFHRGCNTAHPKIATWLSDLESRSTRSEQQLISLAKHMLSMESGDRPRARCVTLQLQAIAVSDILQSLYRQYGGLLSALHSFEAHVEYDRLRSWGWVLGLMEQGNQAVELQVDFDRAIDLLLKIRNELTFVSSRYQDALHPLFIELRGLNDAMMNLLPHELQLRARTYRELRILDTEEPDSLERTEKDFEATSLYENIGMLAFVKRMSIQASKRSDNLAMKRAKQAQSDLRIDPNELERAIAFDDHYLAWVKDNATSTGRRLLVEYRRYNAHWQGSVQNELLARIEDLAEFLNRVTVQPTNLRALHCSAFYHDEVQSAFGFVYEFPFSSSLERNASEPRTLASILRDTRLPREMPLLGDRFKLAYDLASSLLEFHKADWMHKSISSYNVAFFIAPDSRADTWITTPYLIGFNHSRPNDHHAFTTGPPPYLKYKLYHHPSYTTQYMRSGEKFQLQFDYYSLGLVLLEIGLWQVLEDVSRKLKVNSNSSLKRALLEERVPLLGHTMGARYRDAVNACLSGNLDGGQGGVADRMGGGEDVRLVFERQVIEPLSRMTGVF